MINEREVIRIKIPYPTLQSNLALNAHMYICKKIDNTIHEFIKCQTLKPYMLTQNIMKHFCDEYPNIKRNPFIRITRIDCDKIFVTNSVKYDSELRTTIRPDICLELYNDIINELHTDGYLTENINEEELISLNSLIIKT